MTTMTTIYCVCSETLCGGIGERTETKIFKYCSSLDRAVLFANHIKGKRKVYIYGPDIHPQYLNIETNERETCFDGIVIKSIIVD